MVCEALKTWGTYSKTVNMRVNITDPIYGNRVQHLTPRQLYYLLLKPRRTEKVKQPPTEKLQRMPPGLRKKILDPPKEGKASKISFTDGSVVESKAGKYIVQEVIRQKELQEGQEAFLVFA